MSPRASNVAYVGLELDGAEDLGVFRFWAEQSPSSTDSPLTSWHQHRSRGCFETRRCFGSPGQMMVPRGSFTASCTPWVVWGRVDADDYSELRLFQGSHCSSIGKIAGSSRT